MAGRSQTRALLAAVDFVHETAPRSIPRYGDTKSACAISSIEGQRMPAADGLYGRSLVWQPGGVAKQLKAGLYDAVVTEELLDAVQATQLVADVAAYDPVVLAMALAQELAPHLVRAFENAGKTEDSVGAQVALANQILGLLDGVVADDRSDEQHV